MELADPLLMLRDAQRRGYAVGAFNVACTAEMKACIDAAEEMRAPIIIQVYHETVDFLGPEKFAAIMRAMISDANVPVALNLDHCPHLAKIKACVKAGFTMVMIDGSALPLEENIAVTKQAVAAAHPAGVVVEAELGKLGVLDDVPAEKRTSMLTDPGEARRLVEATDVDALAVAIGTAHGVYRTEPRLDIQRIGEIRRVVDVPLVMHGGSGVPADAVKEAVAAGITKINIGAEIGVAFTRTVRECAPEESEILWPAYVLGKAYGYIKEAVKQCIARFGSEGKA